MTSQIHADETEVENVGISFNSDAALLAFSLGQAVERALLDRGLSKAREFNSTVVLIENIRDCVDETLIAEARRQLNEPREERRRKAA